MLLGDELRKLRRRVVVTGTGAVTPVGHTADDTWKAFMEGRSGVRRVTSFDVSDLPTQIAGEVKDFDPTTFMPRKISRRMDHFAQYAMAAAIQAMEESKLTIDEELAPWVSVLIGSGYGAVHNMHEMVHVLDESGPRKISAYSAVTGAHDSPSGEISMMFGAAGQTGSVSSACSTGADAIGYALRWIQYGEAQAVIVGGAENCVSRVDLAGGSNARALSRRNDEPEKACRPFDNDRDGFIMAAGAGVVVIEELEHALRRGAPIIAELVGYSATSDAYHWTAPHPEAAGARRAMTRALADGGIDPSEVDYINAHGTSTELNDKTETFAIRKVLGDRATQIPVSSIKSMTGHMIGAAGAVEFIATAKAIQTGIVPPTINCDNPLDPEMNYVAHTPQEHDVRVAMSNSFGFGGHNASVVLRRWED